MLGGRQFGHGGGSAALVLLDEVAVWLVAVAEPEAVPEAGCAALDDEEEDPHPARNSAAMPTRRRADGCLFAFIMRALFRSAPAPVRHRLRCRGLG